MKRRTTFLRVKITALLLIFFGLIYAQSDGDYQFTNGNGDGDWNNAANWNVYNSGWGAAVNYPGEVAGAGTVYINDGDQIALSADIPEAISAITFNDGSVSATDITVGTYTLTVTGTITFGNPDADAGDQNIFVTSGSLTCGEIVMVNTGVNSEDTRIDIEDGTLIVNGDITMASAARNNIRFVGVATGELYVDGDFNGNGFTMGTASTVYYNSASAQTIANTSYRNLYLTGGTKSLRGNTNVYGTMTLGTVLDIFNRQFYLGNAASLVPETTFSETSMINISNNGYIRRDGNETTDYEMTYPVGVGTDYTPMSITSISGTDVNGRLYIRLYAYRHPLIVGSDNALTRYWDISTTGLTFTSASGSFNYSDNDVLAPIVEGNLTTVGHFDGSTWLQNEATTSYNHTTNEISFSSVSQLEGEWTLGEPAGCFDGLPSGTFSVQNGSWNSASTWNTGVVPGQGGNEDVTVFHVLGDLDVGFTVNSLTIEENGGVDFDNDDVVINNDFIIKGIANDDHASGTINVGGNLTINEGGDFNLQNSILVVTGNVTVDGILDDSDSDGSLSIGGDLLINTTGDFNIQRNILDVTGATNVFGILSDTDGNGSSTFNGLLTIEASGTYTSNQNDFDFIGGIVNEGSFTNSSEFTVNQDLTTAGSSNILFSNDILIADNVILTNENTGGLSVADRLDGLGANASFVNKGVVNYYDYRREPMLTGILDCSSFSNTFNYSSGNRQYIKAISYYNLGCENNDDKELQGGTTVLNNLSTSGTADFECLGNDLTISGSAMHSSSGVFTTGANTVTYNGTSDQNVVNISYDGNLIVEGTGTKSLQNTIAVSGDLTVQGTAVLDLNGQQLSPSGSITINNGATLQVDENATLQINDGVTLTNNGIFSAVGTSGNPATVTTLGSGGYLINQSDATAEFHVLYGVFDYCGGITITDGTVDATNNFSYTSFTNGTGTEYIDVSNLDPIGGMTSIQSAVFETGPTYNVSRTAGTEVITFITATGALAGENYDNDNANPGTLIEWTDPTSIYYSTGDVSAYAIASWAHNEDGTGGNPSLADLTAGTLTLIVQDGHTVTLDSNGDIDVKKLIVGEGTSGSFLIGGDATQQTLTVQELIEVNTGATLIPNSEGAPAHVINLYGNLANNGTVNLRQSFTQVANVNIYGIMEFSGSATPVFSELTFKTGCNATTNSSIDVNWNLILEAGAVFNDGGNTHTIEYNWTNNGGTYNATGGLTFDGGTASITSTGNSTTFNNVTFNSSGLNTIKENTIIDGQFTVSNNTRVSVDNIAVTVNGDFTIESGSEYIQANNYTYFNGTNAQSLTLAGTTSFDEISFANGGSNAKTVTGNIVTGGRLTIDNGATLNGSGDHVLGNGLRIDGVCGFTGSVTMTGGYLEATDPTVSARTLGTAELIVAGYVSIRHTDGGSTFSITVQNDVSVVGGYLVINNDAELIGQPTNTLLLNSGLSLYIRGADNFPDGFGTYEFDPTALVIYDANIDQVVRGGFTYGRLRVQSATKTVDGPLSITGYLDLNDAVTLDLQSFDCTFLGSRIYNYTNSSIDGSAATIYFGGVDNDQYIEASESGTYSFYNLDITQTNATSSRNIFFYNNSNIAVLNDLTIENTIGTSAIQLILDLNDNNITGSGNNLSLGSYCQLNTDNVNFGTNVIDNFTGTVSLDVNSSVYYSLNGAQNIADGVTYGNLDFNGGDKTAEGALDINGDISRVNGTPVFYDGGFTHTLAGDWKLTGDAYYTQTSATGTIVFDGVDQDINGYNFNNLTIANSGTANLFRDLTIYGDLVVNDGSSFDASSLDMTIGGDITVNGAGVYSQSTGTTTLNGTTDQNITLTASSSFGDLDINKTDPLGETVTLLSEAHVNADVLIMRDAGILDITNQTLYIGDDLTIYDYTGVTNFISTGSTVVFNGTNAQYFTTYHEDNVVFNNLVFQGTGDKTFDYNNPPSPDLASQEFEVNGDFTITGSVVEGNNMSIYVRGDWNNNGTFNHTRTVYFDGADQNISSSGFYHVNFQGTDTKTLTGNISVVYDLYIDGTATLDANGNDISVGDEWFNNVAGASFAHGNGKVIFNGTADADIYTGTTTGSQAGKTFYEVEVNKSGNRIELFGDLVVENDLTISSNELRTSAYDVYVAGNFDNQGTYYCNNNASLLTLNGSGGSLNFNPNSATLRGLHINAPGTTYEMVSDFILDNVNMTITAGTLDINENTMQLNDYGRTIDINGGTMIVDSGSVVQFTNLQTINLNSGSLYLVGKEGMVAQLQNSDTNDAFTINAIGGNLYAQNYSLQKGSIVITGATLDATDNLSNGTYTEGDAGTSYIDLTGYDLGAGLTLTGMIFNTGATYNISRTSGVGTITLQDASGGLAGEVFEEDDGVPGTLIDWTFPSGFFWDGQGSAVNTDWNEPLNWDGNTVPGPNNIVYLDHSNLSDAYAVNVVTTDGECKRLNIDIQGGNPISINVDSNTELNVQEHVNIGLGATLTQTDNTSIINIGKNWTNLGTYTPNTGKVVFNGASGNYSISTGGAGAGKAFYDLEINAGTSVYAVDDLIDVDNDLTITSGTLDLSSANNDLTVGGDWLLDQASGGLFTANNADVIFDGTTQSITNGTFYNLVIGGTSSTTVNSNIDINNTITLNSGSALNAQENNVYVGNDWENNGGTFTQTGFGTVIFDGTTTQIIDQGTNTTTFNNITCSNSGTKNLGNNVNVNGDVIISDGSGLFNVVTYTLTGVGADNTLTNNEYLQIEGANNFPTGFENHSFASSSETRYWSDINQDIEATTYGSLSFRSLSDGITSTKTALGDLVVNNDINFTSTTRFAILDMATNDANITLADNIDMRGSSSISWGTGNATLEHIGSRWNIDADITGFNNLVLAGDNDKYAQGNLSITGDLEIRSGVDLMMYNTSGRDNYTIITGTASGTISMETGSRIFNTRPATDGPAIPEGFGTYDFNENSTYYLYSNGQDQTLYTGSNIDYGNLTFDTNKDVTSDGIADLDVNGVWDIEDATYYDGGRDINVAGANIYFTSYVPSSADRTITLDGLRDQYIRDDIDNALDLPNIVFAGTGSKQLGDGNDVVTIDGNLTINDEITVTAARNTIFNGTNWTNNGIYTQTANSLTFSGASDQTIDPGESNASNYFNTLVFSGASTKTFVNNGADINNDLTINAGTVDLGSLDYTIYDEIDNTSGGILNSASANITLDGGGQTVNSPDFEVNDITISGNYTKYLASNWTVNGDLLIESGTALNTTSTDYDINIAGNWTNRGTFTDYESKVTFDGSSTPIAIETGGDNFYDVDFTPSSAVTYSLVSSTNRFANLMYIGANAELDLNGKTLFLGRDNTGAVTHTIDGTLSIDEGSVLYVNNDNLQTTLDVNGTLNILGTSSSNVATLSSETTTNLNKTQINIQSGATMAARYYVVEYVSDEGINLMPGSTLDPVNNFSDGTFLNMRDQQDARYLVLEADYAGGNISNISFNYNGTPIEGRHYNVERKLAATNITFENVSGSVGTYKFEDDDQAVAFDDGLCRWPEITETYWTGAVDSDWHKDGNWDNGVPTSLMDAIIPDEAIDPIIFSSDAVCKSLNITDGTLRLESDRNLTTSEDVIISNGLLFVNSTASNITVGGDWTVDTYGNFNHGDATVTFNSGTGYVVMNPGTSAFYNLVFDNASTTFEISGTTLDIEGDLTVSNGVLRPTTNNYIFNLYGDYTITGGSFDASAASNGTIVLDADADQTITDGDFDNIEVAGTGNKLFNGAVEIAGITDIYSTLTAQTGCSITMNGNVDIDAAGTFNDGGESHTFTGANWYGDGTYTGSGTVTFNRTSGYQYLYDATFNNLVVDCTGQRLILEGDVSITGDMSFETGIARVDLQTYTITSDGTGTFTVDDAVNVYVYGSNNFPKSFATYDLAATSYTRYYSSSDQTIEGVSYGHLIMDNENTKTLSGNTVVKGDLYFNEATIDVSTNHYSLTVGGRWDNDATTGGHFVCRQGEVIFNNTSNQAIYFGGANTNEFYNLTINGSARVSAANNLSNDFIIQNSLSIPSGEFNANTRTIYVGGDLLATGSGSFYPNTGTFYLNKASGTANIGGNGSSLLNLTINSGATYTAQNDLTVNGNFTLTSGVFDGNGNTINLGNGNDIVTIDGTYIVGSGGILGLGNGTSLTVTSGGRIEVVGSESGLARVTQNDSGGRYGFTVEGEIAAEYYFFEYMSNVGIYLTSTSTIDATNHFSHGTFSNGATSGQLFRVENTQSFTGGNRLEGVSFPNNPGGSASNFAKYSAVSGSFEIYNSNGVFAGEAFDNDPNDLIEWTGPISLTWNGSVSTDWNTAANWTPSSGGAIVPTAANNVTIASAVNQPVITIGGQQTGNLTIESGAEIRINTSVDDQEVDLDVDGEMTINGLLRTMSIQDSISVSGNWTVGSSGVVMLNGDVTFDGTGSASLIDNTSYDFYSLTIDGTSQYQISRNTTVDYFTIESGATFDVGPGNYTLTVNEDWINNGTFNAQSGTVILSGSSGTKEINSGASSFNNLRINAPGATYNVTSDLTIDEDLTILNGTLDLQTNTLLVGDGDATEEVSVSGILLINAGATLDMGDGAALNVNSGGYIELLGSDALNRATLTSSTAGRYSFDVNSGGSIKASYYNVDYTDADGLYMHPGADIDATYDLSNGIFSNGYPGTGSYMTLLHEMGVAQDTLRNLVFNSGPAYSVTRTSGTTVFFFEDASGDLGNYLYEKDDEGSPSPSSGLLRWPFENLYTWEGDVDNSWLTPGNWYDDQLPVVTSDVTIPATGTNPVIDNSQLYEMHGLTIESTAELTVQEGARVTLNGDLTTNDGLIIYNSVNNPTSIITNGAIDGETTVYWSGFSAMEWWHISHGVIGVTESEYDASIGENTYALNRFTTEWERVGGLNEIYAGAFPFNDELEGYSLLFRDAGETLVYAGILNGDESYSKSSLTGKWHHFANPYPSYIDVENAGFDVDNFMQTIYVDGHSGLVSTYNLETHVGVNGGTRYISPGQAFWMRNYVFSDFSIARSARVHTTGSLKSSNIENENIFRMELSSGEATDEAVVLFGEKGSQEVTRFDSEKLMNSGDVANIFSLKSTKNVAVNYLPSLAEQEVIPLGYQLADDNMEELTYRASNINNFYPNTSVYLLDKAEGVSIDLRETPSYTFTPKLAASNNRFELVFEPLTTDVGDVWSNKLAGKVEIYGLDQFAIVKVSPLLLEESERIIEVYNLAGQLVAHHDLNDTKTEIKLPEPTTIYIIKVSIGNTSYQEKVVTKN